jgi:MFS family permease
MSRTTNFIKVLDDASWRWEHWKLFATVSANYLLDGIMFSIAPLMAFIVATDIAIYVLAINLLAEWLGALIFGRLADIYGRRPIFASVLIIEVLALIVLYFTYENPMAFLILTSAMTFGIGGEFGAAYAALAELSPKNHRGKALMLATNFWNIGAAIIAGAALIYAFIYADPITQVRMLLLSALGTALVVGIARLTFPESMRWLVLKGRIKDAESLVKKFTGIEGSLDFSLPPEQSISLGTAISRYPFRLIVLAAVTVAQYVTYGMLAYYLPYAEGFTFGVEEAPRIIFVANAGASLGAFLLIPLIDKTRRLSVLLAFLGGILTTITILVAHNFEVLLAFYILLFLNMIFSEWAWGSISVLQSEIFPTGVRASVIGLLVSLTGIAGALTVYSETILTAQGFLAWAIILWMLGLLASIAWYIKGIESARKGVEELA